MGWCAMSRRPNARDLFTSLVVMTMLASSSRAQTVDVPNVWSHGTRLAASAGLASASSDTGGLVGTAIAWEITPRLSVEGMGLWLDRKDATSTFAAALMAEMSLLPPHPLAPFVEAGFGFYRSSFDARRETVPSFYRDRMTAAVATSGATFTDPAFVFGVGLSVFAARHLAIRPQMDVFVVTRSSRTYVVYTAAVQVAYHFENHPITPSR
jgi:hypothetical protein